MDGLLVNKVAQSGIITLDLAELLAPKAICAALDIKPFLFKEMIVKEKEFRQSVQDFDWSLFEGKHLAVFCSADAIIPLWAYMLIASRAQPYVRSVRYCDLEELRNALLLQSVQDMDPAPYDDKRVVIKGCGDEALSPSVYMAITSKLMPVVKSLMFGEPCSTVPVYKRK